LAAFQLHYVATYVNYMSLAYYMNLTLTLHDALPNLLHVVDRSHEDVEQHQTTVLKLLKELGADKIPMLTVYNKKDLLDDSFIPMHHPNIIISALDDQDLHSLVVKIESVLKETWNQYIIELD